MRGFSVFLGKEFSEFLSTWRAWVLPIVIVALGALSPVIAKLQPMYGLPTATTVDAYQHFSGNMIQVVLVAVIISVAGVVSAELRRGTAILMLTKPISRVSFVLAKVAMKTLLVVVSGFAGILTCWMSAQLFFDNVLVPELLGAVGLWIVLAVMIVAVMSLLSVLLDSQAGAAGAGFGIYILLALFTQWVPAVKFSPVGLMTMGGDLLSGTPVSVVWPVTTALLIAVAAALTAAFTFRLREI
ncbi:MAG: ABC transporter permease subunit [Coriobacteriia bacterium]|nr:ABC transporter permease subunit [Coriobacteriia bacterium]